MSVRPVPQRTPMVAQVVVAQIQTCCCHPPIRLSTMPLNQDLSLLGECTRSRKKRHLHRPNDVRNLHPKMLVQACINQCVPSRSRIRMVSLPQPKRVFHHLITVCPKLYIRVSISRKYVLRWWVSCGVEWVTTACVFPRSSQ